MKRKQIYWTLAIILGIGLGIYTGNYILTESKRTAASRELEQWMPAAEATLSIYKSLDEGNQLKLQSIAKRACFCADVGWDDFAELLIEDRYAELDLNELKMLVLPFFKCIEDDVAYAEISDLDYESLSPDTRAIYMQLTDEEKSGLFTFLFLLEMKTSCKDNAHGLISVLRKLYDRNMSFY